MELVAIKKDLFKKCEIKKFEVSVFFMVCVRRLLLLAPIELKIRLRLVGVPILKHHKIKPRTTNVILGFMVGVKRLELLTSSL